MLHHSSLLEKRICGYIEVSCCGYLRTLSVALLTWSDWMSQLPVAAFVEESCEALLSRMSHRCELHKQLVGLESTIDLYLTLPPPSRVLKNTRGSLRQGILDTFLGRIRKLIFGGGVMIYASPPSAHAMHVIASAAFPADFRTASVFQFVVGFS